MISDILTDIDINYRFSCVFQVHHAYYEVYGVTHKFVYFLLELHDLFYARF